MLSTRLTAMSKFVTLVVGVTAAAPPPPPQAITNSVVATSAAVLRIVVKFVWFI